MAARLIDNPYWIGWDAGSWGLSWGYDMTGEPIQVHTPTPRGIGGGSAASRFGTDRTRPRQRFVEEDEALLMAGIL